MSDLRLNGDPDLNRSSGGGGGADSSARPSGINKLCLPQCQEPFTLFRHILSLWRYIAHRRMSLCELKNVGRRFGQWTIFLFGLFVSM